MWLEKKKNSFIEIVGHPHRYIERWTTLDEHKSRLLETIPMSKQFETELKSLDHMYDLYNQYGHVSNLCRPKDYDMNCERNWKKYILYLRYNCPEVVSKYSFMPYNLQNGFKLPYMGWVIPWNYHIEDYKRFIDPFVPQIITGYDLVLDKDKMTPYDGLW